MTSPPRRDARDPLGLRSVGGFAAPAVAVVGLIVIGWLSLAVLTGNIRIPGTGAGPNGPAGLATPAPSGVVIVDPRVNVPGSIVYVKGGNAWVQSGKDVRQLTTSGGVSMASWAPDGRSVFYVHVAPPEKGLAPFGASGRNYQMSVPTVMRIAADGRGEPQKIMTGRVSQGRYTWSYWIRDPVLSSDGRTLAMATDARNPATTDVVIQFLDLATAKLTKPRLAENSPFGHQDPAWSPDGSQLLYVKNGRDGARGAPIIVRYNVATGRTAALTGAGYLSPSWSRDGRFVAATRTDSFGTNVVILDAATGIEVIRLTNDGNSWSPVWSPKGDAIAFLHVENQIIDLRLIELTGEPGNWTPREAVNLTAVSALDGASRPGWFIPADQLPPLPTPTATPAALSPSTRPSTAP